MHFLIPKQKVESELDFLPTLLVICYLITPHSEVLIMAWQIYTNSMLKGN